MYHFSIFVNLWWIHIVLPSVQSTVSMHIKTLILKSQINNETRRSLYSWSDRDNNLFTAKNEWIKWNTYRTLQKSIYHISLWECDSVRSFFHAEDVTMNMRMNDGSTNLHEEIIFLLQLYSLYSWDSAITTNGRNCNT